MRRDAPAEPGRRGAAGGGARLNPALNPELETVEANADGSRSAPPGTRPASDTKLRGSSSSKESLRSTSPADCCLPASTGAGGILRMACDDGEALVEEAPELPGCMPGLPLDRCSVSSRLCFAARSSLSTGRAESWAAMSARWLCTRSSASRRGEGNTRGDGGGRGEVPSLSPPRRSASPLAGRCSAPASSPPVPRHAAGREVGLGVRWQRARRAGLVAANCEAMSCRRFSTGFKAAPAGIERCTAKLHEGSTACDGGVGGGRAPVGTAAAARADNSGTSVAFATF